MIAIGMLDAPDLVFAAAIRAERSPAVTRRARLILTAQRVAHGRFPACSPCNESRRKKKLAVNRETVNSVT